MSEEFYEGILNPFTYDEIAEFLTYDPEAGIVQWKVDHLYNKAGEALMGHIGGRAYVLGDEVSLRRIAWLLHYGVWPLGGIKSLNRNIFDLRIANLWDTEADIGAASSTKFRGRRGVTKQGGGRYRAAGTRGKTFYTREEAAQAVDHAMLAKWGYRINYRTEEEAAAAVAKAREVWKRDLSSAGSLAAIQRRKKQEKAAKLKELMVPL